MGSVVLDVKMHNFARVQGKVYRFPKAIDEVIRESLGQYYTDDFMPWLRRGVKGMAIRGVPRKNAEPYATIKSNSYGIGHSFGKVRRSRHDEGGHIIRGIEEVEAKIKTTGDNKTTLTADFSEVPSGEFPYFEIINEGWGNLHKKYPIVEGVRQMTQKRLVRRMEKNLSRAWDRS